MAGLRAGAGHEQVLPAAGPALPTRFRRDLHAADELGRVHPLHQRRSRRRHERPGRPRFRLAPPVGPPTRARTRPVPRHHILKYRAVLPSHGQSSKFAWKRAAHTGAAPGNPLPQTEGRVTLADKILAAAVLVALKLKLSSAGGGPI